MSIIGTIRNKFTWLLIVLLALAMLAFMLMDSSGPGGNVIGANKTIGNVGGKKVKVQEMQKRMMNLSTLYPNASDEQLRNTAWDNLINERIFDPRFEDLGIEVSKEELSHLILSDNPHPYARQMFSSLFPDGNYDPNAVNEFLNTSENGDLVKDQLMTAIKDAKISEKYATLLKNGVNVPTWMAEDEFVKQYKTVNFDFVMLPYSLISDDEVTVSDTDLRTYAENHRGKFETQDGYVLQYVKFNSAPSVADTTEQMTQLQTLKERFAAAEDPQQFARNNSSSQITGRAGVNPGIQYQTKETLTLSDEQEEKVLNSAVGEVVGPFINNGNAYLTKILDKKNVADSARVRHILINADMSSQEGFNASRELADSLANALREDKSQFDDFVLQYSKDEGSVGNNGVYEYFPQGQMVPQFNTAAFSNAIGDIEVVETQYGFHIMEVLDRKGSSPAVEVATLIKGFQASKETNDKIYNAAKEFERNSRTEEEFVKNAEQYGGVQTTTSVKPQATTIQGLGTDYSLIRWANTNSPGAIKYFSNVNGSTIVARIDSKTKAGEINIEANRTELLTEVRNEKKAEMLKKRIEDNGGANQELSVIAEKLGRQVQEATDAKFGASGTGIGYEPEVISNLFFKTEGNVGKSIKGRRGVYLVNIKGFGSLPPENNMEQYKTIFQNAMLSKTNLNAIKTQMTNEGIIKDERYKIQ